ncbi:MAG: AI-2E family transporter, partial [Alphaproteobacteria bacterium]|nr:AI-2E family transporter [Alphaproteobacteria bacterium]
MPDTVVPQGSEANPGSPEAIQAGPGDAEPAAQERLAKLRTIFVGGLLGLAVLAASYAAAEIVLPILLAFVLNLVFRPVLRVLLRARLPQPLAALIIVLSLVALFGGLAVLLSGPISGWIQQLPQTLPRIEQRVRVLSSPIKSLQGALQHIQNIAPVPGAGGGQQGAAQGAAGGTPLAQRILTQVWTVAGGAFTTLVALFFLLVSGETFLRRLVEIMPGFKEKRQVVDISQEIEDDLSVYLATITMMNSFVGVATGLVAWLCGLGDPLLWGTIAFLLNYVPILGPTMGVIIFFVAGLVTLDPLWMAFVPAGLYILIHVAEGETVTPM